MSGRGAYRAVLEHYRRPEVPREIARFARGRWVAIHCATRDEKGRPLLVRYEKRDGRRKPLALNGPSDVERLLSELAHLKPRTFYASSAIYARLEEPEDTIYPGTALAFTPTWDIDNE
ncbi:hypothetical protein DRO33_04780, partial [Candidatus Bathyarchaeota archaeon]